MEPDLLPQREHLGDRLPPRALRHGRVPGIAAAASAPVDVGTAQALAVAMPMALGVATGCGSFSCFARADSARRRKPERACCP